MPLHAHRAVALLAIIAALAHAQTTTAPATAPGGKLVLHNDDDVVFVGDELTEIPDPRSSSAFPLLVESFLTARYPDLRVHYDNAGWAGDTTGRVLLRLDRDVLVHKLTVVVICLGLNDPQYHALGEKPELLAGFKAELGQLVKRCQDAGARVWLISPPCVQEQAGQTVRATRDGKLFYVDLAAVQYNKTLAQYAAVIKETADARGIGFVDWFGSLTAARAAAPQGGEEFFTPREPRIPQPRGQALLASLLLKAWQAEPILAHVELNWREGTVKVSAAGSGVPQPSALVTVNDDGRRILDIKGLPVPWPLPGGQAAVMKSYWEASGMSAITFAMADPPKLGIRIVRETKDGITKGDVAIPAEQLRSGFNLATLPPLQFTNEIQDLLKLIAMKNTYLYSAWRRLELLPPEEPELVAAHRQLIAAWKSYALGYEALIARYPKTFDVRLILAEAVPDERLPTSAPASRPVTRPSTTRPRPLQPPSRPQPR